MLKIVKTSIAIASISLFTAGNAQADINDALQNICTIVKADDKGELPAPLCLTTPLKQVP
jgi:hypothetical protein